jgi:glucokinase
MAEAEDTLLAGDIGATKTSLALYALSDATGCPLLEKTFSNKAFAGLPEVISTFLDGQETTPHRACFGVAGPVRENRVRMTNQNWSLDGAALAEQFGMERVLLVNDLMATAAGALVLPADKLIPLNPGRPDACGGIGVLAVGTGLGQSFAVPVNNRLRPFPTEGGHTSFAPSNQEQIDLLQFMLARQAQKKNQREHHGTEPPHVSAEQVCSGMALPDLYAFMLTRCSEPTWMKEKRLRTEAEPDSDELTPLIVSAADTETSCEPAARAVQLLVDILAAEAAGLALKVLATGGIYLGGGMVPRLLAFFERERFMGIFIRGIYQRMLADIPVHLIMEPDTALLGARQLALNAGKN